MDEREVEQGYANFHRKLNHILRQRDVRKFKAHVARHPGQAGKLSHCLGLNDDLTEVEMYRAILVRSALRDMHKEALAWLKQRGFEPPTPGVKRGRQRTRRRFAKTGKKRNVGK